MVNKNIPSKNDICNVLGKSKENPAYKGVVKLSYKRNCMFSILIYPLSELMKQSRQNETL